MNELKVLITGGSGFVGSNLIEKLLSTFENIKIVSLDNYSSGSEKNHIQNNNIQYIKGNTWNIKHIKEIQEFDPTYVFHFGEMSRICLSFEKVNETFWSNSIGTQQIIEYCVNKNAKLIYSASSAVFNDIDSSPYVFTKAQNIQLIKNYKKWYGLNYAITYFYNVYGKNQISEGCYSTVLGVFENQFNNNLPLTVVSPGTQSRIFTHIDDIVDGLLLIMENGNGDNYCLSSDDDYTILKLANEFSDDIIFLPERKGERYKSVKEISKTETELNWKSKYSLKDYIQNIKYKKKKNNISL